MANDYRARVTGNDFLVAEQLCLLEGLVRAWNAVRLPALRREYDVVDVEKEIAWDVTPDIRLMVRMDAVLRRKVDGLLFVKDYKTVSAIYDDFGKKFEHDSQLLCYTLAAEAIYGEPIGGLLMEGVIKGKRAKDRASYSPYRDEIIQQSALCYAFKSPTKDGFPLYERSWSRGAEKIPVWEMPGGIERWLATEWSPLDMQELFVTPLAIKPMRRDLERWQRQTIAQELRIQQDVAEAEGLFNALLTCTDDDETAEKIWDQYQRVLDSLFPQNHNHCFRYFGYPCAMERLCFTEAVENDPLNSGFYETRIPHHPTEDEA